MPFYLKFVIGCAIVIIAAGLSFIPIQAWRIISSGVDAYADHTPLFGQHTISQTVSSPYPITAIGFILVNFKHAPTLADVEVKAINSSTKQTVATALIPGSAIKDDQFATTTFTPPLPAGHAITFELAAPSATADTIIGVRFDPKHTDPGQPRTENNHAANGIFASVVKEKVPVWHFLSTLFQAHQQQWYYLTTTALAVIALSMLAYKIGWQHIPLSHHRAVEYVILGLLVAIMVWSRIEIIPQIGGASGGDPYNYLFIAKSLMHGENPLVGEKRLPGFPLLLVPSLANPKSDNILDMRLISIISAAGCLWMLSLLARALKLPWSVQLLAPALIAWQKDFFWTSLRPEPYTFYAFLVVTALVLFFNARRPWQQILYGLVLGYAAMTRQEGFLFAAVLGFCSLFYWRHYQPESSQTKLFSWPTLRSYLYMYLPALLLVSPFFFYNATTYGNPFFTPYFEGDRLQIVNSWEAFKDNVGASWGVLGSMWRPSWDILERYNLNQPWVYGSALFSIIWAFLWYKIDFLSHRFAKPILFIIGAALFAFTLTSTALNTSHLTSIIPMICAGLLLVAIIPALLWNHWPFLVILAAGLSQIGVATWFHPFAKHFQQSLPLIALTIMCGLLAPTLGAYKRHEGKPLGSRLGLTTITAALLLPFAIMSALSLLNINVVIDDNNAGAALDSVLYRAIKTALQYNGPYGNDQGYIQSRLYFDDQGRYFLGESSTTVQEETWVKENNVHVMITTNDEQTFTHAHPTWQQVGHFKSEGKNERLYESFVYLIPATP